jgi:tellurite resistance protein TerC
LRNVARDAIIPRPSGELAAPGRPRSRRRAPIEKGPPIVTTIGTPAMWVGFTLLIVVTLAIDLGVLNRKAHVLRMREALRWVIVWVALAQLFGVFILVRAGHAKWMEFLTGYLIEYALSVDNLFVFIVLFAYFAVPAAYQHRVLFWGILGAVIMRGVFIAVGAALLSAFHWVMYVFGVFLVYTGVKLMRSGATEVHPERNVILRVFRRIVPTVSDYRGASFFVFREGRRYATPLLAVLVAVEATDVVFAVDSIPAIFAITLDPFIVYTSNIFAILGLRSLFFLLAGMMGSFHYLKPALALVLTFIGAKMLVSDLFHVPIALSLIVVVGLLAAGVVLSLMRPLPEAVRPAHPADPPAGPPPRA